MISSLTRKLSIICIVLLSSSLMVVASPAAAGHREPALSKVASLSVAFDNLVPGEVRSASGKTITLRKVSTITKISVVRGGDVSNLSWAARLCPAAGPCIPVDSDAKGVELPRGVYQLRISVKMKKATPQGAAGTFYASISFSEAVEAAGDKPTPGEPGKDGSSKPGPHNDGGHSSNPDKGDGGTEGNLAITGAALWSVAGLAVALVVFGFVLVAVRRRSQSSPQDDQTIENNEVPDVRS